MTAQKTALITLTFLVSTLLPLSSFAADEAYKINPSHDFRKMLVLHSGQTVTLQLTSGKEISGTVITVGEFLVQLTQVSGREFYDAAVDYDHIEAILIRVRNK